MRYLIEFIISYFFIFIIYYIFITRRYNKYNKNKLSADISYLTNKYKIDIKKFGYNKLLIIMSFINPFIMSIAVITMELLKTNIIWQLLLGFLLLFPLIISIYGILGNILEKKYKLVEKKRSKNLKKGIS